MASDDDDLPVLREVLRPGDGPPARPDDRSAPDDSVSATARQRECPLTDDEIETIAARIVERHTARMQEAIVEAIRQAIDIRNREQAGPNDQSDGS